MASGAISGSSPWTLTTISPSRCGGHLGQPVGAGRMDRRAVITAEAAERVDGRGNPLVVGRDEHGVDRPAPRGAPVDVLDHRPAADAGERLAGETGRLISCGDDGDDSSGADGTCQPCRQNDGHGKS